MTRIGASVTTASSPRATEARPSRACTTCFRSSRPASPTQPASQRQTNTPATRPPSARTAAVSCGASAMSPNRRLPPFVATHHDGKSPPDLDSATSKPPTRWRRRSLPSPLASAPLRPRPPHRHDAQNSPRRPRNRSTVSSCQSSQRKQRLEKPGPSSRFSHSR